MAEINISLEDIRDKGGLRILHDAPLGKVINFYGKPLVVLESKTRTYNEEHHPCKGCYFFEHPLQMSHFQQCALFNICTSPNRSDRTSVIFAVDYFANER